MSKIILFLCTFCFILSGCNTLGGLGTDIKKGGEAIERTAEWG